MTIQDPKYKHKPSEKHTLEEVLKSLQDLIRNDLLDNVPAVAEKSAATPASREEKPSRESSSPVREDFAPLNPAAGPVNLDAVMRSLKDLVSNELNVSGETAATAESPPSQTEGRESSENLADEFVPLGDEPAAADASLTFQTEDHNAPVNREDILEPLDEELTFEESIKMVPPPPSEPTMPEVPGEISAEMFGEPAPQPENVAPPPAAVPETEADIAPGTQHQLLFEEAPPPAAEPEPSAPELSPTSEHEPETTPDDTMPEVTQETAAPNSPDVSGEMLPTIDVEENFDESAYLEAEAKQEAEARQTEAPSTDAQITQEIILSALGVSLEPETPSPADHDEQVSTDNLVTESEPASDTSKPEIKLEIVDDSTPDNLLNIPSVDFDVVEFTSTPESSSPSLTIESTAPPEESSPASGDDALVQELTLDTGPGEIPPPAADTEPHITTEAKKIPDANAIPPFKDETGKSVPDTEPATPATPDSINLDDIPVLHEVVAPPAGSALAGVPASPTAQPPLPAPDRARDIVVRAVAKLNVEMRKSGGAGLDTKTILRLQQLIRRELEKDGEKS